MVLGADTGFFIQYARGQSRAIEVWQEMAAGHHTLVVSTVTMNEILVYFYRRGQPDLGDEWAELMVGTEQIKIVPTSVEIAKMSAGYRHGLGLPTVDSIILATFLNQDCEQMLTTDSHFRAVDKQKIISVEFLD